MKSVHLRSFAVSVVFATAVAGAYPLVLQDGASIPIDDRSLDSIRGADMEFGGVEPVGCDQNGAGLLSSVKGEYYTPASGCASVNLGEKCGSCTLTVSGYYGVGGQAAPYPTGHANTDLGGCGLVLSGTCGVSDPTSNPPTYDCVNLQPAFDGQGHRYSCSDLIGMKGQASDAGAF